MGGVGMGRVGDGSVGSIGRDGIGIGGGKRVCGCVVSAVSWNSICGGGC